MALSDSVDASAFNRQLFWSILINGTQLTSRAAVCIGQGLLVISVKSAMHTWGKHADKRRDEVQMTHNRPLDLCSLPSLSCKRTKNESVQSLPSSSQVQNDKHDKQVEPEVAPGLH